MNADSAWKATLGELELQMTKATFSTWLKDARLLASDENEFVIGVRNDYAKDWLENRLRETIVHTLTTITGKPHFCALCRLVRRAYQSTPRGFGQ